MIYLNTILLVFMSFLYIKLLLKETKYLKINSQIWLWKRIQAQLKSWVKKKKMVMDNYRVFSMLHQTLIVLRINSLQLLKDKMEITRPYSKVNAEGNKHKKVLSLSLNGIKLFQILTLLVIQMIIVKLDSNSISSIEVVIIKKQEFVLLLLENWNNMPKVTCQLKFIAKTKNIL